MGQGRSKPMSRPGSPRSSISRESISRSDFRVETKHKLRTPPMQYPFSISVGSSTHDSLELGVIECVEGVADKHDPFPDMASARFIMFAASSNLTERDQVRFAEELRARAPNAQLWGMASYQGVMTLPEVAFVSATYTRGYGVLALYDDDPLAGYGVGMGTAGDVANMVQVAAEKAVTAAKLRALGRWDANDMHQKITGEYVVLVSCQRHFDPDLVTAAVKDFFGSNARIAGGMPAPNAFITGELRQELSYLLMASPLEEVSVCTDGVVIAVLAVNRDVFVFPTQDTFYPPTPEHSGVVTAMAPDQQTIVAIDGRHAHDVINEWHNGRITDLIQAAHETQQPQLLMTRGEGLDCLARVVKDQHRISVAVLAYEHVSPLGVRLAGPTCVGQEVLHFRGTMERIARQFAVVGSHPNDKIGAIPFLCLTAVLDATPEEKARHHEFYNTKMRDTPYLMPIVAGEFGAPPGMDGVCMFCNSSISEVIFARKSLLAKGSELYSGMRSTKLNLRPGAIPFLMLGEHRDQWRETLRRLYSEELMDFWLAVEDYREWRERVRENGIPGAQILRLKARFDLLYSTFVRPGATSQINLPSRWSTKLAQIAAKTVIGLSDIDVIFLCQDEVVRLVKSNCLFAFKRQYPELKSQLDQLERVALERLKQSETLSPRSTAGEMIRSPRSATEETSVAIENRTPFDDTPTSTLTSDVFPEDSTHSAEI